MSQVGFHQAEPAPAPGPAPGSGGRRPGRSRRVAVMAGIAVGVFVLAAVVTGGAWDLAAMIAMLAAVALVVWFVARGGLAGADEEERSKAPPIIPPPPKPEISGSQDGSGSAGPASDLADRFYVRGAWFRVTVHEPDSAGHRIDLTGPLCPACHEPMLRAREREPLENSGDRRAEVYKCHRVNLHPLVTVQVAGEEKLVDQARSACLHEMASGRFDSLPAEGDGPPDRTDGPELPEEGPKPEGPNPPGST